MAGSWKRDRRSDSLEARALGPVVPGGISVGAESHLPPRASRAPARQHRPIRDMGIFTQSYGPGQAWIANQDGTFNSASNPAARGTYVAFWVTGQGLVNTTLGDGTQPTGPPYPSPMLPVSVSLGGSAVPAANLAFDGLVYCGEVQINLLIPAKAPTGSAVPLVVTIGGASSRTDATIAIQ